jgi:hypothetical protein
MRNVPDKICRENQNLHFMFNNFISKNLYVYETMWRNTVVPGKSDLLIQNGAEQMQEYRHALGICISYCFTTATNVTRTRLNKRYVHRLSCCRT